MIQNLQNTKHWKLLPTKHSVLQCQPLQHLERSNAQSFPFGLTNLGHSHLSENATKPCMPCEGFQRKTFSHFWLQLSRLAKWKRMMLYG